MCEVAGVGCSEDACPQDSTCLEVVEGFQCIPATQDPVNKGNINKLMLATCLLNKEENSIAAEGHSYLIIC